MWIISLEHRGPVMAEGGCWMVTLVPALPFVFFAQITFARIQMFEIDVGTEVGAQKNSHAFSTRILDIRLEEF
jgi:hypothetical protein